MDFPITHERREPFPWRRAAMIAAGVAAVELVLLVVVGGALLVEETGSPKRPSETVAPAKASTVKATAARPAAVKRASAPTAAPKAASRPVPAAELPRRRVEVLVLNGNGRTGAAAVAASRVGSRGYRVSAVGNAPRQDYPQSIVLYRGGFEGEGRRLARDLGVTVVGPLDGMRAGQLGGAHVVYILGA